MSIEVGDIITYQGVDHSVYFVSAGPMKKIKAYSFYGDQLYDYELFPDNVSLRLNGDAQLLDPEIGALVRLRSGGPVMQILSGPDTHGFYNCDYGTDSNSFHPLTLKAVN